MKSETAETFQIAARHGVVTLFGYGIQVRVDRGHLWSWRTALVQIVAEYAFRVSGTG